MLRDEVIICSINLSVPGTLVGFERQIARLILYSIFCDDGRVKNQYEIEANIVINIGGENIRTRND